MKTIYLLFIIFYFIINSSFVIGKANILDNNKKTERTIIKSNKINKEPNNIIKAIGDVEIKKGDRIFNANEIEYNQTTKTIKANSEVKVLDEKENNLFFSETAEMTDDFNTANFYNGIIIFKNGSNISSPHIEKISEHKMIIDNSRYSICPTDKYNKDLTYEEIMKYFDKKKIPLFSLRSSRINANPEKKQLSLWGTSVWLWKIPVFYIPYLKTGLAFKETLNGFSVPGIKNTSHYGYGLYAPYKITTKTQKAIITPKIYQKGNYLMNIKYNIHPDFENNDDEEGRWNINFLGDIANDNGKSKNLSNAYGVTESEEGDYKKWRGYASSNGFYNFNDLWNFDYNSEIVTDRYYFRDYYQNGIEYIESNFKFTNIDMKSNDNFNYFQFSNLFYQELLENDTEYNTPRYAPVSDLNLQNTLFKNNKNNFFYKIKLNTTNLFRKVGIEYNRITLTPTINNSFNSDFGILNINFEIKSDLYILNEVGMKERLYNNTESRVVPQINIEWRKSFATQNILFQPIIKYSGSPNFENFENKIPDEDSKPQGISFEDIFSNNRFVGYDRQEYGNRFTFGFETIILNNFSFGIAQGYRDNNKNDLERLIGFENTMSDYVGYISYIINDYLDIYYRFLTDKDNFNFKRNEITLNLDTKLLLLYLTYVNMDKNLLYEETQKQINSGVLITIFKQWKINISGILDIEHDNRFLESKLGLMYDGGCIIWEISYTNYNPLSDTNKNTSINFNFVIKFL